MKDKTISEILDELKEAVGELVSYEEFESDPFTEFLDNIEPPSYMMWTSDTIIDKPQENTIYIKEYVWLDGRWVWL